MEAAEKDIDMHAKVLDMVNSFMDKVQTNTNKQNEYIHELEKRIKENEKWASDVFKWCDDRIVDYKRCIEELEEKLNNMPSVLQEVEEHLDFHRKLDKRIAAIENRMNMCGEDIQGFDDKIDGQVELLEDKLEERIKKIEIEVDRSLNINIKIT